MWNDIGKGLKNLAKIIYWIELITIIIAEVVVIVELDLSFGAIILLVVGFLVCMMFALVLPMALYGLGQLVENSDALVCEAKAGKSRTNLEDTRTTYVPKREPLVNPVKEEEPTPHAFNTNEIPHMITCPECGRKQNADRLVCFQCGHSFESKT